MKRVDDDQGTRLNDFDEMLKVGQVDEETGKSTLKDNMDMVVEGMVEDQILQEEFTDYLKGLRVNRLERLSKGRLKSAITENKKLVINRGKMKSNRISSQMTEVERREKARQKKETIDHLD